MNPLFVKLTEASLVPEGLHMETVPLAIVPSESTRDTRCPAEPSKSSKAAFSEPVNSAVFDSPSESLPVEPTFEVAMPLGGIKRSGPVLEPSAVATDTRPPSVAVGTLNLIELVEADVTSGRARLSVTDSKEADDSKFEPEIVTSSPAAAIVGEIEETWGADDSATVKASPLATGPSSEVETVTEPLVAPPGTLTVSDVADAALTVAVVPLNLTVSEAAVVENPVPSMVTVVPISPLAGVSWVIANFEEAWREIESRFPAASQL